MVWIDQFSVFYSVGVKQLDRRLMTMSDGGRLPCNLRTHSASPAFEWPTSQNHGNDCASSVTILTP